MLGDRVGTVLRHVGDRDRPLPRRSHVDHVVAGREHRDEAQRRQRGEHRAVEARLVGENDLGVAGPLDDQGRGRAIVYREVAETRHRVPRVVSGIQGLPVEDDDAHAKRLEAT